MAPCRIRHTAIQTKRTCSRFSPLFQGTGTKYCPPLIAILREYLRFEKNPQIRASLAEVRSVIDGHIKDLQDLLKESPNGVDMNKARHLLEKFKMLRGGKT